MHKIKRYGGLPGLLVRIDGWLALKDIRQQFDDGLFRLDGCYDRKLPQGFIHLDSVLKLKFTWCMRAGLLVLAISLQALAASAQQESAASPLVQTNANRSGYSPSRLRLSEDEHATDKMDVIQGKHFQVSGPLVHVAKSKSIWSAPRRFLYLINPFAKREPQLRIERLPDVSPNAWTTTVGWNTGKTALDDPFRRCDGGIGLVTVSRTER